MKFFLLLLSLILIFVVLLMFRRVVRKAVNSVEKIVDVGSKELDIYLQEVTNRQREKINSMESFLTPEDVTELMAKKRAQTLAQRAKADSIDDNGTHSSK